MAGTGLECFLTRVFRVQPGGFIFWDTSTCVRFLMRYTRAHARISLCHDPSLCLHTPSSSPSQPTRSQIRNGMSGGVKVGHSFHAVARRSFLFSSLLRSASSSFIAQFIAKSTNERRLATLRWLVRGEDVEVILAADSLGLAFNVLHADRVDSLSLTSAGVPVGEDVSCVGRRSRRKLQRRW